MHPLSIEGAWSQEPVIHSDHRGRSHEWFRGEKFRQAFGHDFPVAQVNVAVSHRGALRGIHYAEIPPGQAKYSVCVRGAGLDVIVDVRVGSPTFGRWEIVPMDAERNTAVYLTAGLGRAFLSLTDDATLVYLCSSGYAPEREHSVNPLDPDLGIVWPADIEPLLSDRDKNAPTLATAERLGLLPTYQAWQEQQQAEA
ncbi:dTDP-4-dehydro-6-deoxyglucose 3-epimerase GerF [Streptomyces goshikiensis]|uniref:dTDP-4-dehydro-6-deoxyglucose 3-epimerase GerF n=1 Tax=Streptomyces goshikiensis TaxID=1942 RepID=UPI0037BAB95B